MFRDALALPLRYPQGAASFPHARRRLSLSHRFSILERIRSFRFAIHGVILTVQSQHNAWIHLAASIVVVTAGSRPGTGGTNLIRVVTVP